MKHVNEVVKGKAFFFSEPRSKGMWGNFKRKHVSIGIP